MIRSSLQKHPLADATVTGAVNDVLKLTLRLGNILYNQYFAKAINSSNAPNCYLP